MTSVCGARGILCLEIWETLRKIVVSSAEGVRESDHYAVDFYALAAYPSATRLAGQMRPTSVTIKKAHKKTITVSRARYRRQLFINTKSSMHNNIYLLI